MSNYILDGKKAIQCRDIMEWVKWFETKRTNRSVANETVNGARISTIFLGIDHSFGSGPPLLFETMVFGGPLDQEQERCTTWEEAEEMHRAMVEKVVHNDRDNRVSEGRVD